MVEIDVVVAYIDFVEDVVIVTGKRNAFEACCTIVELVARVVGTADSGTDEPAPVMLDVAIDVVSRCTLGYYH